MHRGKTSATGDIVVILYEQLPKYKRHMFDLEPRVSVQGPDSLEVVHGGLPPESRASNKTGWRDGAKRGGIHAFGKCYIPYTSQGNKEVKYSRATVKLVRTYQFSWYIATTWRPFPHHSLHRTPFYFHPGQAIDGRHHTPARCSGL